MNMCFSRKVAVYFPTAYNDGTEVPQHVLDGILEEIYVAFNGYTIAGSRTGVYPMDDGSRSDDKSLKIVVAMNDDRVDEFKELAGKHAASLEQECLYTEVMVVDIELIRPTHEQRKPRRSSQRRAGRSKELVATV